MSRFVAVHFIALILLGSGATEEKNPPLCIGVMGASVSAGFMCGVTIADVLDKAITVPHKVVDSSTESFFLAPEFTGKNSLNRMKKENPGAVIGLDFFFWYSYGIMTFEERRDLLRKGCSLAGELDCVFIAGDIPDMREAAGGMLRKEQIPSPEEIAELNTQLRAWAAKRPNIHIVPLAEWITSLKKGKAIKVNGKKRSFKKKEILQQDDLHATPKGTVLLAVKCLEHLAETGNTIDKKALLLDVDSLAAAIAKEKELEPVER